MSVHDDRYSRNTSYTLNKISLAILYRIMIMINIFHNPYTIDKINDNDMKHFKKTLNTL